MATDTDTMPTEALPPQPPAANGAASGPRIRRREVWIDIDVPEYEGFQLKAWVNYPHRLREDALSGDLERQRAALLQIVLEHNHWHNYEGEEYPPANTLDFWEGPQSIETDLALAAIGAVFFGPAPLPSSLKPRSGR